MNTEECPMMMDLTLPVTPDMLATAWSNTAKSLAGHLGTHFDVMDQEFPLAYTQRRAVVFDVSAVRGRDITCSDIDLSLVEEGMFAAFYTSFVRQVPYGTPAYFRESPQLSHELIGALLEKHISIIGLDCAGIRRAPEHVPADQRCADQGVFVVENLWDLDRLLSVTRHFTAFTYPLRISGITGLPCRVVAEIETPKP